jgi:hypothetical protein
MTNQNPQKNDPAKSEGPRNPLPGEPGGPTMSDRTIADEQRERSDKMQAEGVERVKARLDERDPNEKPRSVPGVHKTAASEAERSTPPARAAQNKAAP